MDGQGGLTLLLSAADSPSKVPPNESTHEDAGAAESEPGENRVTYCCIFDGCQQAKHKENKDFGDFSCVRDLVRSLGLSSSAQYVKWAAKKGRPFWCPRRPDIAYSGRGWREWPDFLGVKTPSPEFWTLEEARDYVKPFKLKNSKEFIVWACGNRSRPAGLPLNPAHVYRKTGWLGWTHFLAVEHRPKHVRKWGTYEQARKFVTGLNLPSSHAFKKWVASGERPKWIPVDPVKSYSNKGWSGWADFLGANLPGVKMGTYSEVREWVRQHKILTKEAFTAVSRPSWVPADPELRYEGSGWVDWDQFLAPESDEPAEEEVVGVDLRLDERWCTFEQAKEYVRKHNIKSEGEYLRLCMSNRPSWLPLAPDAIYANHGWKSWEHFTGHSSDQPNPVNPSKLQVDPLLRNDIPWQMVASQPAPIYSGVASRDHATQYQVELAHRASAKVLLRRTPGAQIEGTTMAPQEVVTKRGWERSKKGLDGPPRKRGRPRGSLKTTANANVMYEQEGSQQQYA